MWADGEMFHAIRADAPAVVGGKQYERTAALIDIDDKNFYVLDIFRTIAGSGHYKFVYGPISTLTTSNLHFTPSKTDLITGGQLRNFALATNPPNGWSLDWNIEDRFHQLPKNTNLKMRYTDLSTGVDAITAEAWIAPPVHLADNLGEAWIPCLITRKTGAAPLSSTFVSVLEPFEKTSTIKRITRLLLHSVTNATTGADVGLYVELISGDRDYVLAADPQQRSDRTLSADHLFFSMKGMLCVVRADRNNSLKYVALSHVSQLQFGDRGIIVKSRSGFR